MNQQKHKLNNKECFDKAWKLYEASFPEYERRSLNQHIQAIEDSRFHPYVYTSSSSELLAICFYWEFLDFIYLEHFAVHQNWRNKGIGAKIISTLTSNNKPIILEIEPPINQQQKQRLRFYERHHFTPTDYTFKQLRYNPQNQEVFLKLLCSTPMNDVLFEKFKSTIYKELQIYCETN